MPPSGRTLQPIPVVPQFEEIRQSEQRHPWKRRGGRGGSAADERQAAEVVQQSDENKKLKRSRRKRFAG